MDPEWRSGTRLALRLLAAHHPLCGYFRVDVVGRRIKLCSGCVLTWPAAVTTFALLVVLAPRDTEAVAASAAGLVLGLPQATTYLHRGGRAWRAAAKLVGGVGLGMLLGAGLQAPVSWDWKLAGLAAIAGAFIVLQAIRMRTIMRTCRACPWQMDWAHCPGFTPLAAADPMPARS